MKRLIACWMLLIVACSESPTESAGDVRIEVEQLQFSIDEPIRARIVNEGDEDVSFFHCNHRVAIALEKREAGSWDTFMNLNGRACLAIYPSGPLILSPQEVHDVIVLPNVTGEFRLRAEYGKGVLRIAYIAHSPPFEIQ